MRYAPLFLAATCFALGCPATNGTTLTASEAQQAMEESSTSSQAETLVANGVEISTNFTIGKAVKDAAAELRDFIASQLPCAEITLADAKLTIDYGKLAGTCSYNGHNFAGRQVISVTRNDAGSVLVRHEWSDFNNGKVSVTGSADVTWNPQEKSRRVVHDLTWTVISGPYQGRSGEGTGDRTQTPLAGGVHEGIRIDGTRAWHGKLGQWSLDINAVEVRWRDAVPQAGSYVLDTPFGKTLTLTFGRVDDSTIKVTLTSGTHSFDFNVNAIGQVARR